MPFIPTILPIASILMQQYSVRALAPLAQSPAVVRFEPGTRATTIAAGGSAAGCMVTESATRDVHACRWNAKGAAVDLGTLGTDVHSAVLGGNAAGDLVGTSFTLGALTTHGVLWRADGVVTALGDSEPVDINASRIVASNARATGNVPACFRAVRWSAGASAVLPVLAGGLSARASAISESGWIVGQGLLADRSTTHACVWTGTAAPIDLGTLGGTSSYARDIDGTVVVGVADLANGTPHACRWTLAANGTVAQKVDLGALPGAPGSSAEAIAADGRIGGNSGDAAVLFRADGPVDLNTLIPRGSGWTLTHVTGFGDGGRIVGRGRLNGLPRAFVLEPIAVEGDLDGNGHVDAADLGMLLASWGGAGAADLDGDGSVGAADLAILLARWNGG